MRHVDTVSVYAVATFLRRPVYELEERMSVSELNHWLAVMKIRSEGDDDESTG